MTSTKAVILEVLRAYKEQREHDSSTLVARSVPWDAAGDRVMTPKQVLEHMHRALQEYRGRWNATQQM